MPFQFVGTNHIHHAKAPGIVETYLGALIRRQDDVVVLIQSRQRLSAIMHNEAPRHAQVAEQHLTVVEVDLNVLGAAADVSNAAPFKPCRQVLGQWKPQSLASLLYPDQAPTLKLRPQPPDNGLHFRQLRH
jgi:hypothetical protein